MAWLHWKELQGSPFHSRPSDFSFLFCQLIKKKKVFLFQIVQCAPVRWSHGLGETFLNESRLFGLAYYSEWCFPCLATFKRSEKKKKKTFRLPQSESKRKMENLHILFLCLCTVPCRFLRWLSLFLFFQPIIRPFLLSVSLNDHPERKKTLWYSYRNQSNVIFESHPSRDRAEKNIKWSRTSRCGPASICRVHYVMDDEVGANKNSKQSRRKWNDNGRDCKKKKETKIRPV